MLNQQTVDQLLRMKLSGMSRAYQEQLQQPTPDLTFEERFGLLVDREWTYREDRRLKRRLKAAKLREPSVPMIVRHFLTLNLMYNGGGKERSRWKRKKS